MMLLASGFERGPKGRGILDEEPVARRNRGNAARILFGPGHYVGVVVSRESPVERCCQIFSCGVAIQNTEAGKQLPRGNFYALGQSGPEAGSHFIARQDLAQCGDHPGGLRASQPVRSTLESAWDWSRGEAEGGCGLDPQFSLVRPSFSPGDGFFREQIQRRFSKVGEDALADSERMCGVRIGVYDHEQFVQSLSGNAAEGINRRMAGAEACEDRTIQKKWMIGQQTIQFGQLGNNVIRISPGKAAAAVNIKLFGSEPFDSARKTKAAAHAGQGAEPVSEERPGPALCGQPLIVMGFAVVDVESHPFALAVTVI